MALGCLDLATGEGSRPGPQIVTARSLPWSGRSSSVDLRKKAGRRTGQGDAFDRGMASFAEAYADQNEQDYTAFKQAAKSGRIAAVTGI